VPEAWPRLSPAEIEGLAGLDYEQAAYRIMRPYLEGDPSLDDLEAVLDEAYGGFHHPAIAPLRQIGPASWLLELFHGPTLAFKDLAMQVLARLMNRALSRRGARATIGLSRPRHDRHLYPAPQGAGERRAAPADDERA
jgi:threonine synthase